MGKRTLTVMLFVSLLISGTAANVCGQKKSSQPHLLETGEFHGDEVSARTGERWLGLHVTDDHSTLLRHGLTVESVYDPITDYGANERTGKKVSVDLPLEPTFLVKGAKGLSSGPVTTVFKPEANFKQEANYEKSLEKISPVSLKLGDIPYILKVVGPIDGAKCSREFPRHASK